jgi:hypothetical protein
MIDRPIPINSSPAQLAERMEELRREIMRMNRLTGGKAISISNKPGGIGISINAAEIAKSVPAAPEPTGGELLALALTQDTQDNDDYDRGDDDTPVTVRVVTEIQYDITDHKLYARTRTLQFNRAGRLESITAESARVEITEAVLCSGGA